MNLKLLDFQVFSYLKEKEKGRIEVKLKPLRTSIVLLSALVLSACGTEGETEEVSEETAVEETADEGEGQEEGEDAAYPERPNVEELDYGISSNDEYIEEAEQAETEIREEFENGEYTLENPLVVQNPYGVSPLSAVVLFETDEAAEITVSVAGDSEETTITHTVNGSNTLHQVPVLGLYPGRENIVELSAEFESGETGQTELTMTTEAMPEDFYTVDLAEESRPAQMEEGLTFMMPSAGELFGVDSEGEVRYYITTWMSNNFEQLDNGNMLLTLRRNNEGVFDHVVEMDRLGRPYNSYVFEQENFDGNSPWHHDVIELPSENWLALVHDGSGEYVEDEMIEIDNETGEIVYQMNFKDIFPAPYYEEYDNDGAERGDWWHQNAVWLTEDEESVLVSGRNQDMVMKMSYPGEEIEWILTTDENWPEGERPDEYLLEPLDEDIKIQMGQHAVEELPDQDGDPATMDIMIFDNNRYITRGQEELHGEYSQAVQYRINEEDMTVEEIWSYGEERGEDYYSHIVGDADYLAEANNVLVTPGRTEVVEGEPVAIVTEVTRDEENEVVYEVHISEFDGDYSERRQIYRSERMPLYTENSSRNILEN